MFIEKIRMAYDPNTPIFTKEILKLFPEYSRAQIFRLITNSIEKGELIKYSDGVYFMPTETIIGPSTINADMVIEKKYLRDDENVYGIYGGIKLLNTFSITTQMAGVIEVVTNNESTRRREILIKNRKYILKQSKCQINKENVGAYTIMELFNECDLGEKISDYSKKKIKDYANKMGTTKEQLLNISMFFPSKAIKNLLVNGVLNEFTQ